ncbi:MAG: metal ABC transporter substrate-binding protein [Desulfovibrio sp.]|jgi:ABC-type Zn uptake system ZnuABC Zn-binding protein ZnuA|nr:metal ABC transporter substrate-binding protein [Desulfovibrio sp.]
MLRPCLILILLLLLPAPAPALAEPLRVVASTFPLWLITRNVARDVPDLQVDLLIPARAGCPHDYALNPREMLRLAGADLLILNGMGLDSFVLRSLESGGKAPRLIDTSAAVSGRIEGNPHLFASPALSALLAERVGAALAEQDPGHAADYLRNAEEYAGRMRVLAGELAALGARLGHPAVLVQHDIFDYLARDAGLTVAGTIGSPEGQEPSAARLLALRKLLAAGKVAAVIAEPQYPDRLGRILAETGGIPLLTLDPAAGGPADASLDYFSRTMLRNIQTLEKALGSR